MHIIVKGLILFNENNQKQSKAFAGGPGKKKKLRR
jgi:hypothetical protein